MPGVTARCMRCSTVLRHNSTHRAEHIIALALTAFVLLVVMCSTDLMTVEKAGITRVAGLFSGPQELVQQNMAVLGAVIVFVTVVAPLCRLIALIYVLVRSHEAVPPPPSSPPFRDHRAVASLVDDGGLCFWSFRRLCETRRSCHDRSRDRGLRPDGADLRAGLDRFDARPRGGMGAPRPALDADTAGIRAARGLRGVRAGQHAASRRAALPALRRRPASSASRMPSPAPGRC